MSLAIGFLSISTFEPLSAQNPQRIASLSLASDEILLELIPQCGGLGRIVALSTFVDNPSASSVVETAKFIKARVHSEPESLFVLKPDLVIGASFNRPELLAMVKTRKIDLLTLQKFSSADDIAQHITEIGDRINCVNPAANLRNQFLRRIRSLPVDKPSKTRVMLYSSDMVTMGKDTLFDDMVMRAGARNVVSDKGLVHWPKIDTDTLLSLQPETIIVFGKDTTKQRLEIQKHNAWGRLEAVRKGRLIFLDSRTAQSTSHFFADAVEELRKKLD